MALYSVGSASDCRAFSSKFAISSVPRRLRRWVCSWSSGTSLLRADSISRCRFCLRRKCLSCTELMAAGRSRPQHPGCEVRGTPLSRTPVNKGKRRAGTTRSPGPSLVPTDVSCRACADVHESPSSSTSVVKRPIGSKMPMCSLKRTVRPVVGYYDTYTCRPPMLTWRREGPRSRCTWARVFKPGGIDGARTPANGPSGA
jgi:hypothetical protein